MSERLRPGPETLSVGITAASLVAVGAIAWAFLVAGEAAMADMTGDGFVAGLMRLMMVPSRAGPYLLAAASMWIVMMVAMMIPAALTMVATYRRLDRSPAPGRDAAMFVTGYLTGWSAYAVTAAGAQWWLHTHGLLGGMMLVGTAPLAASLLIAAGIYQLTPWKDACLARCRSPLGFFVAEWRDGPSGALRMGLRHGLFCIGCCWVLMALMFVGGAMSVVTMAALCVFILAERLLPAGPWVTTLPGLLLIGWGVAVLVLPASG